MHRLLARFAWLPSVFLSIFGWLLVRPLGNFPLNDDWQYARVSKLLLEKGRLYIDTDIAPTVIGQVVETFPLVKLFGLSHTLLRLCTIAVSLLCLIAIDALLKQAKAAPWARIAATCVLALNPYWFYLSGTFMTEVWGVAPSLLAAVLWFRSRGRRSEGAIVSLPASLLAGLLCGIAYWTRQFAMLALPALFLSSLPALRGRFRASLPALLAATLACALVIGLWFPFAHATGSIHSAMKTNAANLMAPQFRQLGIQCCFFVVYMSGFLLPLLLLFRADPAEPHVRQVRRYVALPFLLAIALAAALIARNTGETQGGVLTLTHTRFPYMGNVLYDAGLGPITGSDLFNRDQPPPAQWGETAWHWVELVFGLACGLWAFVRTRREGLELAIFGAALGILSMLVAAQVSAPWFHERYNFPGVVGLTISLGSFLPDSMPRPSKLIVSALALLLIGGFTVAAVHDQFRWQEARAELVAEANARGIDDSVIEAGYELNGWNNYDGYLARQRPRGCINYCTCVASTRWHCRDDSYFIGFTLPAIWHYQPIAQRQPATWLTRMPPLLLGKRSGPPGN